MPSLYLHIPFCEKKCMYCDFYSIESLSPMEDFLNALDQEIGMYAGYGDGVEFQTIFFGGGTPSLLTPRQIERILTRLQAMFRVAGDAEITVETNPGTVTLEKLHAYRELGVNRLSIGIQSFHDDELRFLSRIHESREALRCVEDARRAGFQNLNLDFIYALPGQTLDRWRANLMQAIGLHPAHISAYGLIVEDATPLARMVGSKQVSPAPAEDEAALYEFTMEFLEAHGFEHYEVSNYARPGRRSRHNYNYWCHENYLGFGPSAHSFWRNAATARRWWNVANISHYRDELLKNRLPLVSDEFLSTNQLAAERIFLGLRSDGLNLRHLHSDFDIDVLETHKSVIESLVEECLATLQNDSLRLTRKGYLLCDEISRRLLP